MGRIESNVVPSFERFTPCAVIPVYNHEHAIGAVVAAVLAHDLPCVLVDDASSASCAAVLDALASADPQRITLLRHAVNRGKGGAVLTGGRHAAAAGFSHALQIDADGQHCTDDIPRFLQQAAAAPDSLIAGCPQYDDSVPALRFYARYLTHVWVWINTLSLDIKDSMCGFRVYPLPSLIRLAQRKQLGERMNFDIEVLVRLYWDGVAIVNLPTRVAYPLDGVSHFRAGLDNLLISRLHATLFFGMLWRAPRLLARRLLPRRGAA
ncbi:glycosyltransferase family 2 protein [Collimonas sp.]|jgi:glycosyltransferase involved in cell wall biosynthesis|uniref:glycosyltransferase family 2 protein n=1 Tax=Collimonas sp. TaxID=1963772 RepID=UPI002D1CBF4A|nr:glycosyltransferase family 2 protein [Collimonas sp.]HWX02166.1 glycosyltransferase family 2 protein [Collimonas sp.]